MTQQSHTAGGWRRPILVIVVVTAVVSTCLCALIFIRPDLDRHPAPTTAAQREVAVPTLRGSFTLAAPEPTATSTPTDTAIPPTNTATPTPMPAPDTPAPAPTPIPLTATSPLPAAPTTPPPTAGPPPGVALVAAGVWKCPAGIAGARYVGSSESDKFHVPSCTHAKKIEDEYRLCFLDKPSAIAYGYVACGVCRP
jgi:hypothetical protein